MIKEQINLCENKATKLIILVAILSAFAATCVFTVFVPYCEHTLKLPIAFSEELFSTWLATFFMTHIFAGYLGQKYLGYKFSISAGLLLSFIGEFALGAGVLWLFYAGLVIYSLGSSLYTVNLASALSEKLTVNDKKRSQLFVIFYVSMNIGAFFGDFISGFIAKIVGYHWVFLLVSPALLLTYVIFLRMSHCFTPSAQYSKAKLVLFIYLITGGILGVVLMQYADFLDALLFLLLFITVIYLLVKAREESRLSGNKAWLFLLFSGFIIIYWGLYMLFPSMVEIYIEHHIKINLMGELLQPSTIAALSPLALILLGSILAFVKKWRDSVIVIRNKLILGFCFIALSFCVLMASSQFINLGYYFLFLIIVAYFLYAASEILIGPIGYAMIGILVPSKLLGVMVGFRYLLHSVSGLLTGVLTDKLNTLDSVDIFLKCAELAVLAAILLVLVFVVKKGISYVRR